jgi:hypothetical protein
MEETRHEAKISWLKELEKTRDEETYIGPEVKMESFRQHQNFLT